MKKSIARWTIIFAAIILAYHIVIFTLPIPKTPVFWISYVFTLIAMAIQIYVIRTAFYHKEDIKSKFYGFPIAKIGMWYLLAQLIIGFIFAVIGAFTPIWIPLIIYAGMLCAVIVGLVAANAAREEVEQQEAKTEKSTFVMRELQAKVTSMASQVQDENVASALRKLAEEFRFSDPVSAPLLEEIESKLTAEVEQLYIAVQGKNSETILPCIQSVSQMLFERNLSCKSGK